MRRRSLPVFLAALSLALVFMTGGDSSAWRVQTRKYERIVALARERVPGPWTEAESHYGAIRGLFRRLDPHSTFLDPQTRRAMEEDQQGGYYGIGVRLMRFAGRLTVVSVMPGTPAARAGILSGDVIVRVDGREIGSLPLEVALSLLRGADESEVRLEIRRTGVRTSLRLVLRRAVIPNASVTQALKLSGAPRAGYIALRTFATHSAEEVLAAAGRLRRAGCDRLLLDLRGNPGGSLEAAISLAEAFLARGEMIVSVRGPRQQLRRAARADGALRGMPLAVLIDRGSASSSEIVAAALQDHGRAVVVGTRSWGKGLVETLFDAPGGCAVALTTARYYTPRGKSLQRDYADLDEYLNPLAGDGYDTDRSRPGGVVPDRIVRGEEIPPFVARQLRSGTIFSFARTATPLPASDDALLVAFRSFLAREKVTTIGIDGPANRLPLIRELRREALAQHVSADAAAGLALAADPVVKVALVALAGNPIQEKP